MSALSYHVGPRFQRGRGIGSMISGLFKYLLPVAKTGLKAIAAGSKAIHKSPVGKSLINTAKDSAVNMAADLIEGKSLNEAASRQLDSAKTKVANTMRASVSNPTINVSGVTKPPRKRKRKKDPTQAFNLFQ